MQNVSLVGDNLHKISNPTFGKKTSQKNIILSSAEFAERVLSVKVSSSLHHRAIREVYSIIIISTC